MKRTIENLLYSNIFSYEQATKDDPQFKEVTNAILKSREQLIELLSEEQKQAFYKYEDNCNEHKSMRDIAFFVGGFKLGAQIIIEVLYDNNTSI